MKITVLGAGTWGSALARLLRLNDHEVTLWSSKPEQAAQMAAQSDGAIVGSAIIRIIDRYGKEAAPHVGSYVRSMKDAL